VCLSILFFNPAIGLQLSLIKLSKLSWVVIVVSSVVLIGTYRSTAWKTMLVKVHISYVQQEIYKLTQNGQCLIDSRLLRQTRHHVIALLLSVVVPLAGSTNKEYLTQVFWLWPSDVLSDTVAVSCLLRWYPTRDIHVCFSWEEIQLLDKPTFDNALQ